MTMDIEAAVVRLDKDLAVLTAQVSQVAIAVERYITESRAATARGADYGFRTVAIAVLIAIFVSGASAGWIKSQVASSERAYAATCDAIAARVVKVEALGVDQGQQIAEIWRRVASIEGRRSRLYQP